MKLPMYAIRDVHVGFLTPTVDQNDASAMRNFRHAIQQESSIMHTHAKDFSLYKIADYDTDTGEVDCCIPELIADGFSML